MERQSKFKRKEIKITSIYTKCMINRTVTLPITTIGKNLKSTLESNIASNYEGKCVVEGFIKPNS